MYASVQYLKHLDHHKQQQLYRAETQHYQNIYIQNYEDCKLLNNNVQLSVPNYVYETISLLISVLKAVSSDRV